MPGDPIEYPIQAPHGWASSFRAFREASPAYVRSRLVALVPDASPEQVAAWDESIPPLQVEVGQAIQRDSRAATYDAVLEYQLPLNHRRPDVLLLMDGTLLVVEAKGKARPTQADVDQVAAYARDLHAYHESCADVLVKPVLMLTRASGRLGRQGPVEIVGADAIDELITEYGGTAPPVRAADFLDPERYRPLPSLIKAARELFETGDLRRVRRASAATAPAIAAISRIAHVAARTQTRHLVLVTGSPGTGKTLVGLSLAHAAFLDDLAVPRADGQKAVPAVFLSGNGPLVEVLQYELKAAGGGGKAFVRDVKSYVERYLTNGTLVPGEHVVIFDEAQRAWDAAKVGREHQGVGPAGSEPEHLLRFAERIPEWCVVVGLIGSGQEIHDGEEAGLGQWRDALDHVGRPAEWTVTAAEPALEPFMGWARVQREDGLSLVEELRYHSAETVHEFVDGLVGEAGSEELARLAHQLEGDAFHLRVTRDLQVAKRYLQDRYADNPDARFGVVASSRDRELPRFGVFNDWNATKNVRKGPWYCDPGDDPLRRSCRSLVDCVTEFGAQGLELDSALVAWGTDFLWEGGTWTNRLARRYQAPHLIRDALQLRRNAYRVLLTRGRDGSVVFVPPLPILDPTYERLLSAGFRELDDAGAASLGSQSREPEMDAAGSLPDLLASVRRADGMHRMEMRDPIAAYGTEALPGLVDLAHDGYGAFAVRTIGRIADKGAPYDSLNALREIDRGRLSAAESADLDAEIARLAPPARSRGPKRSARQLQADPIEMLVRGGLYARRDLHDVLGGNRQKGISYPAGGSHALLFSGGTGQSDYGYEDHWIDSETFAYYGEWSGTSDMAMSGGNAVIVDRSPNLYLFLQRPAGYEFIGQFQVLSHRHVEAARDGRPGMAIVFELSRVADSVAL
jgi:hypothetical protein